MTDDHPPKSHMLLARWRAVASLPDLDHRATVGVVRLALLLDHVDGLDRWSATRPSPRLCFFALLFDLRHDLSRAFVTDPLWPTRRPACEFLDEWFFNEAQGRQRWPTLPDIGAL